MRKYFVMITLSLILAISFVLCPLQLFASEYTVSIRPLMLTQKERIVGYKLKVMSGKISSLLKVPIGWNIVVDNDPSWNTNISGSVIVGAAALKADYFNKFVQVEHFMQKDIEFDLSLEIITTTDFEKQKKITLTKKDLVLTSKTTHK